MAYPTPEEFYDSTPPRIMGTEMEYHVGLPLRTRICQQDIVEDIGLCCTTNNNHQDDVFTELGSRIYYDQGHTEIASPESLGPREAALTEHAGARVIVSIARALRESHPDIDFSMDNEYVLRRAATYVPGPNRDSVKTKGYHQNFQLPADCIKQNWRVFEAVMSSFLAVKPLISGAGFMTDHYSIAQKMHGVSVPIVPKIRTNSTTHGAKPLATILHNHYDLLRKSTPDWAILETRSSDPLINPHATFLDLASTSLCLRLIERRLINETNVKDYSLEQPITVARSMSRDLRPAFELEYALRNGVEMSAPILLGKFAALFCKLNDSEDLPPDERYAASEWAKLAEIIAVHKPGASLPETIEWATKQRFIDQNVRDNNNAIFQRIAVDMKWSSLGEKEPLGRDYFRNHSKQADSYQPEILAYTERAPDNTRAHARAEAIKAGAEDANWSIVTLAGKNFELADAYKTTLI